MAVQIATVTGHYALLDALRLFAVAQSWTQLRWDTAAVDGESLAIHELILQAPGHSGTEEIFIGLRTYQSDNNDYYNLEVAMYTGYVPGNSFTTQPGYSGSRSVPLWDQSIDYWLVVSGGRLVLAAKIDSVFEAIYLGKMLPYATPGQYPYPLTMGAPLSGTPATRYSDTGHSWPFNGGGRLIIRFVDGAWRSPEVCPFNSGVTLRDSGGDFGMLPLELNDGSPNVYGELEGVFHITGFNNSAENTLLIDGVNYVVLPNIWRTGFNDHIALRLS